MCNNVYEIPEKRTWGKDAEKYKYIKIRKNAIIRAS